VTAGVVRRALTGLMAALPLAFGCASHHTAAHPLAPALVGQLRAEVDGRSGLVRYTSAPISGVPLSFAMNGEIHLRGEYVVVTDDERGDVPVPLAHVTDIDANHPVRGGIKGGGVGLVGGLLVGILVGSLFSDSCPDERERCERHPASLSVIALAGGLLGAAIGAPIGAVSGAGPVWRFQN
jgi:hypothetical protein